MMHALRGRNASLVNNISRTYSKYAIATISVSYTHLTLPTMFEV